jgi:hypothetical protein
VPAYNFQRRFASLVRRRIKRQTIRALRKDGRDPKAGQLFVGYTGMRTKLCRQLVTSSITEVYTVSIGPAGIRLDDRLLTDQEAHDLAIADGFSCANEMLGWFIANHGRGRFVGHVIRWL